MENFEGKVALVTACASGLGLSMAKAFLQQGMKVAIADVNVCLNALTWLKRCKSNLRRNP